MIRVDLHTMKKALCGELEKNPFVKKGKKTFAKWDTIEIKREGDDAFFVFKYNDMVVGKSSRSLGFFDGSTTTMHGFTGYFEVSLEWP